MEGEPVAQAGPRQRRHRQFVWLRRRIRSIKRRKRHILLVTAFALFLIMIGSFADSSVSARMNTGKEAPLAQPEPNPSVTHLMKPGGFGSVSDFEHWCGRHEAIAAANRDLVGSRYVYTPGTLLVRYPITLRPLCLHNGVVYLGDYATKLDGEEEEDTFRAALEASHVRTRPLEGAFFAKRGASVMAVPAMALLVHGNFAANHVVHLIHDVLEALWDLLHAFRGGALLRLPRQAVLFRSRETDWAAAPRPGDASKGTALSATVLNGFSSARGEDAGASSAARPSFFFPSSLVFEHGEEVAHPPAALAAGGGGGQTTTYCFCQALFARPQHPTRVSAGVYHGIRNAVVAQFAAERPYGGPAFAHPAAEEKDRQARRLRDGPFYWPARPGDENGAYQPRVLFIQRAARRIADADVYMRLFRESGFRVEGVFPETLSVAEQFHVARYADVVVGMHGQGLIHAMWMDPAPPACRTVLEFLPYVNKAFPVQYPRIFGQYLNLSYLSLTPTDVIFGPEVTDTEGEKARLMSNRNIVSVFRFSSLANQTCLYRETEVRAAIEAIQQRLSSCLYPS